MKKPLSIDLNEEGNKVQPVSIQQPRMLPSSVQPMQQNQLKDEKKKRPLEEVQKPDIDEIIERDDSDFENDLPESPKIKENTM